MNTPNNDALILDIRIADLKRAGDALVRRKGWPPRTKDEEVRYEKLYHERKKMVSARWHMVPPKYRAWCSEMANKTNLVMKEWRRIHRGEGVSE